MASIVRKTQIQIYMYCVDNMQSFLALNLAVYILPLVFELLRYEVYISFRSKTYLQSCRIMPNNGIKHIIYLCILIVLA